MLRKGKMTAPVNVPSPDPEGPSIPLFASNDMPSFTPDQRLKVALNSSLTNGIFYDTKLYAFSCRGTSGVVGRPLGICANSAILKSQSTYFMHLFSDGFIESLQSDIHGGFPSTTLPFNDHYSYWEDSDLEDGSDNEQESTVTPAVHSSALLDKELDTPVSQAAQDGEKETSNSEKENVTSNPVHSGPGNRQMGQVIVKPDVAFKTLRALVFWLHTGDISFSPLRSEGIVAPEHSAATYDPHACSPKSMYRLACEVGSEPLKKKTKNDIRSKLTPKNVLPELFSEFASVYSEIRDKDIIQEQLKRWSRAILSGELTRATEAMIHLTAALLAA